MALNILASKRHHKIVWFLNGCYNIMSLLDKVVDMSGESLGKSRPEKFKKDFTSKNRNNLKPSLSIIIFKQLLQQILQPIFLLHVQNYLFTHHRRECSSQRALSTLWARKKLPQPPSRSLDRWFRRKFLLNFGGHQSQKKRTNPKRDRIMVPRKEYPHRKPRRPDLQARWEAKSDYITKKIGICGIIWEAWENEQFIGKEERETAGSERFGVKLEQTDWIDIEFKYTFLIIYVSPYFLAVLSYFWKWNKFIYWIKKFYRNSI